MPNVSQSTIQAELRIKTAKSPAINIFIGLPNNGELVGFDIEYCRDRPRYRANTRWAPPPLLLPTAAPLRTPRRASAQLMT